MMKISLFILQALLSVPPACAVDGGAAAASTETARTVSVAAPVSYNYGMEQRRRGDHAGAKETFLKMLEAAPGSGGALEGLSLACISLGQYDEARGALDRWNAQAPRNPYVLGLLLRAQNAQRDEEGALATNRELAALDPRDCAARERMDTSLERLRAGFFPAGRTYRSYSMEGLDTSSPQRILYEGNSAGSRFLAPLKPGLDLIGGAEIREEAQRNDGRGFTYYDILEQIYSAGLSGRSGRDLGWEAEYGESVLSDVKSSAVGHKTLSRARLSVRRHYGDADLRLALGSLPKFVRGSGGTRYFILMRENSARAEAEAGLWGWNWLVRSGVYSTSDGTALGTFSLRAQREAGANVFQAAFSHGQQEFYGASADGKLRYVNADRLSAGLRRGAAERYRAAVSAAQTLYSDHNRLAEFDASLDAWLPWNKEFYGSYAFSLQDFRGAYEGYNSVDQRAHWLGVHWRRCRGLNWSAGAAYERGFLRDSLMSYQANRYSADFEWYRGAGASVRLQLLKRDSAGRGKGYSAGLQARYSFL
ncbi:MAG TPA: tetratricopeptide repeat protein [Elusimicrobiales bacterium]|nr:tetratricopeptide repeat protein [Elusimicrobiales bacterium]